MEITMPVKPVIHAFFDEPTNTVSYLVADPETKRAAVLDPVLDYDHRSGTGSVKSADAILAKAADKGFKIDWVFETHAHADHLSGAPYIKIKTGAKVAIGERIREVQKIFRPVFNAMDVSGDGSEFDLLFKDGDTFEIGNLKGEVLATPGHTPACVSYKIGDAVFVGDTLFMPDYGTARADFPGGDARTLYRSIRKLMALPAETRLFMCHDYLPESGRSNYAWETTVGDELARNIQVHKGVSEDEFVAMRSARDATLAAPTLLLPSIQVNIRAGKLPPVDKDGVHYLKIPVRLTPF
jgi:glyoxylase-like metal-dependent hydrolase (beta-lactamase superfamily II)